MSWTAPMTAVSGAVLTAAQWNTGVRDNLLETAAAKATQSGQLFVSGGPNQVVARTPVQASVQATESTISSTFTDLDTIGPQVTADTGTSAIVFLTSILAQGPGNYATATYDVSGATTVTAVTSNALNFRPGATNQQIRMTSTDLCTGLTPGKNVFTMRYASGGAGTAIFAYRTLTVIPL